MLAKVEQSKQNTAADVGTAPSSGCETLYSSQAPWKADRAFEHTGPAANVSFQADFGYQ